MERSKTCNIDFPLHSGHDQLRDLLHICCDHHSIIIIVLMSTVVFRCQGRFPNRRSAFQLPISLQHTETPGDHKCQKLKIESTRIKKITIERANIKDIKRIKLMYDHLYC